MLDRESPTAQCVGLNASLVRLLYADWQAAERAELDSCRTQTSGRSNLP